MNIKLIQSQIADHLGIEILPIKFQEMSDDSRLYAKEGYVAINMKYQNNEYEDTGLGFRFTFYRKNVHGHVQVKLNDRDLKILEIMKENSSITIKDLAKDFNVTEKTIFRAIQKLKELNKVERVGSDKNGYWKVLG
mgnify:CR=1 FL=1